MKTTFRKDWQYYKFCFYGFLKNQRFFEPFLLLIFLRDKGLSFTQIGTLYSIRFILRSIFEIPSGVAADALGRRGTMLVAYSFYMVSFVTYYLADTFTWLIIPSVLFAMGDAFRTGTHKAMIFEYLKRNGWQDQKVAYYGHTRSWSQTGSAISSLLAAAIVLFSKDYNIIFLFSLIPYTLGFILLATYPGYLEGTGNIQTGKHNLRNDFSRVIGESIQALKKFSNLRLAFNVASHSGYYNAAKDYLQILISTLALSLPLIFSTHITTNENETVLIGLVYFVLYFITAAASRYTGSINALFKSTYRYLNFLLLAGLLAGLGAGIFYQYKLIGIAIILFISILAIENLRRPAGVSVIADNFNESILASVLSAESQLNSVIGACLSFLIGFSADVLNPGYALSITSMLLILLFPVLRIRENVKS